MNHIEANDSPAGLRLTDTTLQIFRDQAIDTDRPGSILQDFETLLDFIGGAGRQNYQQGLSAASTWP